MIMKKKVYVVILNYNNADDTIACINSFCLVDSISCKLVIVDNNSTKECIERLRGYISKFDNVEFIETGKNLGYAGGNNVGIRYSISLGAEYIAIVNNDVIVNKNSFDACIKLLDEDSNVAFVGPTILEYNSNIIQYAGGMINIRTGQSIHLYSNQVYQNREKTVECDYVGGACLLFRASIVEKIGYLPENYFLFWEESEWCYRARKAGYKCLCTFNGYVNHKGSASIRKESGFEAYYLEKNRMVFLLRNNNGWFSKTFAISYIYLKTFAKAILKDRKYFEYFSYYYDGLMGYDRYSKYRV